MTTNTPRTIVLETLSFNLGNAVAAISRAASVDALAAAMELAEARQFIDFEVARLERTFNHPSSEPLSGIARVPRHDSPAETLPPPPSFLTSKLATNP